MGGFPAKINRLLLSQTGNSFPVGSFLRWSFVKTFPGFSDQRLHHVGTDAILRFPPR